jgi:hypothetical protein
MVLSTLFESLTLGTNMSSEINPPAEATAALGAGIQAHPLTFTPATPEEQAFFAEAGLPAVPLPVVGGGPVQASSDAQDSRATNLRAQPTPELLAEVASLKEIVSVTRRLVEQQQVLLDGYRIRPPATTALLTDAVQRLVMNGVDALVKFNGQGTRTFTSFYQEFCNVADAANISVADRLMLLHSKVTNPALSYAMQFLEEEGGISNFTLEQYVEKMIEGKFGESHNLMQRIHKAIHVTQKGRPLVEFLKDKERYVYSFRNEVPGVVCAAITLEGMDPFYVDKLQSNPSHPEGIYATYRELRNRAMGLAQYEEATQGVADMDLDKGKEKLTWSQKLSRDWEIAGKKRAGQFPQPDYKKPSQVPHQNGASGSKDMSHIRCRRCSRMGHASAASPKCPEHNPNYVKESPKPYRRNNA